MPNPNHDEKGRFADAGALRETIKNAVSKTRAASGGEHAKSNGYFYKGGQFLPSTELPPGSFKIQGKILKTGRVQVEPGKWEQQPTPLHRPIYELVGGHSMTDSNKMKLREGIYDYGGKPISHETEITPGVKGMLSTESHTYGDLIGRYNKGERWVEVKLSEDKK